MFVTDWRSATPETRYFSIHNFLADLNVAVDELGPPVDLIGLCQGGWLALVYAARFPKKVRRLVLSARRSTLRPPNFNFPVSSLMFRSGCLTSLCGRERALYMVTACLKFGYLKAEAVLQNPPDLDSARGRELCRPFRQWYAEKLNLPEFLPSSRQMAPRKTRSLEGALSPLGNRSI